jgi:hypothetical protein
MSVLKALQSLYCMFLIVPTLNKTFWLWLFLLWLIIWTRISFQWQLCIIIYIYHICSYYRKSTQQYCRYSSYNQPVYTNNSRQKQVEGDIKYKNTHNMARILIMYQYKRLILMDWWCNGVLTTDAVDSWLESRTSQTKDYTIDKCWISTQH